MIVIEISVPKLQLLIVSMDITMMDIVKPAKVYNIN